MGVRLSAEMADEIAAVARTDSVSISDAVRAAIATHIFHSSRRSRLPAAAEGTARGLGAACDRVKRGCSGADSSLLPLLSAGPKYYGLIFLDHS